MSVADGAGRAPSAWPARRPLAIVDPRTRQAHQRDAGPGYLTQRVSQPAARFDDADFPPLTRSIPSSSPSSAPSPPSSSDTILTSLPGGDSLGNAPSPPPSRKESPHSLDRFAPVYVPQWLLAVNAYPAVVVAPDPQSAHRQDLVLYASKYLTAFQLETLRTTEEAAERRVQQAITTSRPARLANLDDQLETLYAAKMLRLQRWEYAARKKDMSAASLYKVSLKPLDEPHLYLLENPSLRESFPLLEINDHVALRQLRNLVEVPYMGVELMASVHSVRRVLGQVVLRCEELEKYKDSMLFNANFRPSDRPFFGTHAALIHLDNQLPSIHDATSLSQAWLFPTSVHAALPAHNHNSAPGSFSVQFVDRSLNLEQQTAVLSIVTHRRRIPYLISGPPGTGKTKTLIETTLQILQHYDTHVLVCGASNASADTLALRLAAHLRPSEMLRLCDESRSIDDIRSRLLPYCNIVDGKFRLPDIQKLLRYKVLVTSLVDASVLTSARVTNANLAHLQDGYPLCQSSERYEMYWADYCLVDEAGQATEADIASALAFMLPDKDEQTASARRLPQLVLCGDPNQLGPTISSEDARQYELDVSLLQRLFEREVYSKHPRARANLPPAKLAQLLPSDLAKSAVYYPDAIDTTVPFANLVKNYRSHSILLMVPSALFYSGTLEPFASDDVHRTALGKWSALSTLDVPLLVEHIDGQEESFQEISWYNDSEIDKVVQSIKSLVASGSHGRVTGADIAVISPFREQIWRIRLALRAIGLGDINVGDMFDMQGQESRIVIITTVRTSMRFIDDDRKRQRGILLESRRFNVAMTRAKELLLVFGHIPTLVQCPFWASYVRFALRRGAYRGPAAEDMGLTDDPASGISRLEHEYVLATSGVQASDDGELLAGNVARLAME